MDKDAFIRTWKESGKSFLEVAQTLGIEPHLALRWVRAYREGLAQKEGLPKDPKRLLESALRLSLAAQRLVEEGLDRHLPPAATLALKGLAALLPHLEDAQSALEADAVS